MYEDFLFLLLFTGVEQQSKSLYRLDLYCMGCHRHSRNELEVSGREMFSGLAEIIPFCTTHLGGY